MTEYSRSRDTSNELTEVRTVLSRAATAAGTLDRYIGTGYHPTWRWDPEARKSQKIEAPLDPDIEEMRVALDACVRLLDRWRRSGKTKP